MCNSPLILILWSCLLSLSRSFVFGGNHILTDDGCLLPTHPANGNWKVYGRFGHYSPDQSVERGTILHYKCNTEYVLHPDNTAVYCDNGEWSLPLPECLKTCKPIRNTRKMTAICKRNNLNADCEAPYDGTLAEVKCTSPYEAEGQSIQSLLCENGSWDSALHKCVPICGMLSTHNAQRNRYPWIVGIYRNDATKSFFCNGFIISPEITVTSAHCVPNPQDPSKYILAAGKYYRDYSDPRDQHAAYSKIKIIKIHDEYKGHENKLANEIAILVLEKPFEPSPNIMPVCVDYNPGFDESSLVNIPGVFSGWGCNTKGCIVSEELRVMDYTFYSNSTCQPKAEMRPYYQPHVKDRMCAGLTNKDGPVPCIGDGGAPLIFKKDQRYFARGIMGVVIYDSTGQHCDPNQVTLFTSVHHHIKLIQSYVMRYARYD